MQLIYCYIKQFRNIINQEIYFSHDFVITYNPEVPFPDALVITPTHPSAGSAVVHKDSMLSNVHIVVGKTGAGKTNIFQLVGMTEEERVNNEENWGSYFLLYAGKKGFLIEPFNIPISDGIRPKWPQSNDPAVARLPEYIKEHSRLRDSMHMFSFGLDETGKPKEIKAESENSLGGDHTFIFNGYDRNAFSICPYPEDKEDLLRMSNIWQDRELAEFNRTALLCSCRHLKEYIDHFAEDNVKRKAAFVIRNDNWAKTIKQHIDEKLVEHDYWTFVSRQRSDEEEYVLKGIRRKRKSVSIKNQFVHDLWTDFALYLREWISYIEMYPKEVDEDNLDSSGTVDVHQEFLDYYFEKEQEESGLERGIDPTVLPDFENISIVKRLRWLAMWIDRRGGEYAHHLLWQISDDITDIGNILNKFDDKYFTGTTFTLPIVDMYRPENKELVKELFERIEQYHPDDTGIFTKELLPYHFSCISSGEFQLAKVLGGIEEYCVRLSVSEYGNHPNLIYLLDEPETYMHPELCRVFLNKLDQLLKERADKNDIQVLLSTHSPFMMSDALPEQVTRLDLDENGYCVIKNDTEKLYFSANIHTILADGFFLDYTIGEYARRFLQAKLDWLRSIVEKAELSPEEQKELEDIRAIEPIIGDMLIKQSFNGLLQRIEN